MPRAILITIVLVLLPAIAAWRSVGRRAQGAARDVSIGGAVALGALIGALTPPVLVLGLLGAVWLLKRAIAGLAPSITLPVAPLITWIGLIAIGAIAGAVAALARVSILKRGPATA